MIQVADAIVAELNAHAFSQTFTAARMYLPEFELKDLQTLHVTVVPRGVVINPAARHVNQHDIQIDIAVQKKTDVTSELDALMGLVQEITLYFQQRRLTGYAQASWLKTEILPVYDPDHLREYGQFTSVATFTYRCVLG
jgi:hypothetical protein